MRPCAQCGRMFEPVLYKSKRRISQRAMYCGDACRKKFRAERAREWFAAHPSGRYDNDRLPDADAPAELTPVTVEWDVSCLLHGTLTSYQWTVGYARLEQMAGRRRCAHCHQPVTISRALVTTAELVA